MSGQLKKRSMETQIRATCLTHVLYQTGMKTEILQYGGKSGYKDVLT